MLERTAALPAVIVVIPCYNHGAFLPETLASVRSQTYPRLTFVVVDDGSTDPATLHLMDDLRRSGTRILSQTNQGLAAARNAGVRATDAPFFVPLDADDQLHPRFVERLLPPLLKVPRLGYCYAYSQFFGKSQRLWRCPPYDPYQLVLHNLSNSAAVVRRAAFDAAGGYQSDMVHGYEDWDFWLALLKAGFQGQLVPEALFCYRQHARGVSMLARLQDKREALVRRMIAHHRDLYCELLGLPDAADQRIYEEWQAAIELDQIERSRFWRFLHPSGFSATQRLQPPGSPSQRLAQLKASAAHRFIQSVKRTRLHRWLRRLEVRLGWRL